MYQIISDGACDLSAELLNEIKVETVPFYVATENGVYQKEGVEMPIRDFYQFMIDNPKVYPKSSLPSIKDYLEVIEPILKRGEDVMIICLTIKFSGSYNSAIAARDILLETYSNRKIAVIDSREATVVQGMLVMQAAELKKQGYTFEQLEKHLLNVRDTGRIFFTIGSMGYLVNGGRVGKLSGIAAGTLGLRPIIVFEDGEISNGGVVRGRKISKKKVIDKAIDYLEGNHLHPNSQDISVGYGYDEEEAKEFSVALQQELIAKWPDFELTEIPVRQIGATIGVHTGPLPLGLGLLNKT